MMESIVRVSLYGVSVLKWAASLGKFNATTLVTVSNYS